MGANVLPLQARGIRVTVGEIVVEMSQLTGFLNAFSLSSNFSFLGQDPL